MIGLVVRFDIQDAEAAVRFDELTAEAVAAITDHEPGTLVYATHAVEGEPLARVFYELYADRAAFDAHNDSDHIKSFHERKDVLLSGPVRVEYFGVVGPAKGIPVSS